MIKHSLYNIQHSILLESFFLHWKLFWFFMNLLVIDGYSKLSMNKSLFSIQFFNKLFINAIVLIKSIIIIYTIQRSTVEVFIFALSWSFIHKMWLSICQHHLFSSHVAGSMRTFTSFVDTRLDQKILHACFTDFLLKPWFFRQFRDLYHLDL